MRHETPHICLLHQGLFGEDQQLIMDIGGNCGSFENIEF
jgi:hypothetical protein